MEARVLVQPGENVVVAVGFVVVADHMDLQAFWNLAVDRAEELQELSVAVLSQALADHHSGQDVQRSKERGRAVAFVIVGHRARPPLFHRQGRLDPIESLDLALLV